MRSPLGSDFHCPGLPLSFQRAAHSFGDWMTAAVSPARSGGCGEGGKAGVKSTQEKHHVPPPPVQTPPSATTLVSRYSSALGTRTPLPQPEADDTEAAGGNFLCLYSQKSAAKRRNADKPMNYSSQAYPHSCGCGGTSFRG